MHILSHTKYSRKVSRKQKTECPFFNSLLPHSTNILMPSQTWSYMIYAYVTIPRWFQCCSKFEATPSPPIIEGLLKAEHSFSKVGCSLNWSDEVSELFNHECRIWRRRAIGSRFFCDSVHLVSKCTPSSCPISFQEAAREQRQQKRVFKLWGVSTVTERRKWCHVW